jgi:hypothetical protein
MKEEKARLFLLVRLLARLGAVVSAFAAGSHLGLGCTDGAFDFDK